MNIQKIYALFIILITISATTYAQEETDYGFNKGDLYVSGAIKYRGVISQGFRPNSELFVQPSVGYFISDKISLGVQSEFGLADDIVNTYGVGIHGRYNFMPKKRFNVFTELAAGYQNSSTKSEIVRFMRKSDTYDVTFSTGMNYFITKNLSLFTKFEIFNYSYSQYKINGNGVFLNPRQQEFDQHQLRIGTENLQLGIMYKF